MPDAPDTSVTVPLVEERVSIEKRKIELGRVHIRTEVEERLEPICEDLERESVSIERVPVGRVVSVVPTVREEDGVVIVPIMEEMLVVERRLVLKEELHIRKERTHERLETTVPVRRTRARIEREDPQDPPGPRSISDN